MSPLVYSLAGAVLSAAVWPATLYPGLPGLLACAAFVWGVGMVLWQLTA